MKEHQNGRGREWAAITVMLLVAALLRLWQLGEIPPGHSHDEVANGLIARQILDGDLRLYFVTAYGHEPLYHYVQAASVGLLGENWLGLRFPSAALGLLGLAAVYVLIRRLFGAPVALLTGSWLAVSFWPLLYARIGLRAISLHFLATLGAYFMLRATQLGRTTSVPRQPRQIDWLLAGILFGASAYTYMASRALPAIVLVFLLYRYLSERSVKVPWLGIAVMVVAVALTAAPLAVWLARHPGAEYRISEVSEPLDRMLTGDLTLVWENLVANLKFLSIKGDPWPHQNIPGRPVFADWLSATVFYVGLAGAVVRWRDPRYGFLLIWLFGGLGPSVISSVAPSSIRDILALAVVYVFPALAVWFMWQWPKSQGRMQAVVRGALVAVPLMVGGFTSLRDYLYQWPQNDDTRYFYQADLADVGHELDRIPSLKSVAVAGLSPRTMDLATLEFSSARDMSTVRLADTRETLVVPNGGEATLYVPSIVPVEPSFQDRLRQWGAVPSVGMESSYTRYDLPDSDSVLTAWQGLACTDSTVSDGTAECPVSFGGVLAFEGYAWLADEPTPGQDLVLLTHWRVQGSPPESIKLFIHLTDDSGAPLAQHDGLGSPPVGWQPGDLVIQKHVIPVPQGLASGSYQLRLGVYEPASGTRLSFQGGDSITLQGIEVAQ